MLGIPVAFYRHTYPGMKADRLSENQRSANAPAVVYNSYRPEIHKTRE